MSTLPRKCAPSAMATRGETTSPSTDPLSRMSTFSAAFRLPRTWPKTTIALATTWAVIRALAPMVSTWSRSSILPSTSPSTVRSSLPLSSPLMTMLLPMWTSSGLMGFRTSGGGTAWTPAPALALAAEGLPGAAVGRGASSRFHIRSNLASWTDGARVSKEKNGRAQGSEYRKGPPRLSSFRRRSRARACPFRARALTPLPVERYVVPGMTSGATARGWPLPTFARTPPPARLCHVGRLVATLEQRGLDGLVAYLRPNVFYLSGFAPPASASVHETNGYGAVVLSRHAPEASVLVVAEFDLAHVLGQPSWVTDVRPYATLLTPLDVSWGPAPLDRFVPAPLLATSPGQHARRHHAPSLVEAVRRAMRDLGLARATVGFDDLRFAGAVAEREVRVVDAYGTLKHVRQVKTAAELRLLREATRVNQAAIEHAIGTWGRGMTWAEMTRAYHTTAVALGGFVRDPGAVVMANAPET